MKKLTMGVSGAYSAFFVGVLIDSLICESVWCRIHDRDLSGILFFNLLPLLPVFLLTLITYRMKEVVFQHWMRFAVWATPLLIVLSYLVLSGENNGLGVEGVIGAAFNAMVVGALYVIFIAISLWRIYSMYSKTKNRR